MAQEGTKTVAADILPSTETVARVQDAGGEILEISTDVASEQSTQAMARQALERFGRIDILANNAAILLKPTPFDQISETEWDRVMAVKIRVCGYVAK